MWVAARRRGACDRTGVVGLVLVHVAHEIFISPKLAQPLRVADVLVHELVHVAVGIDAGHRGAFAACARKIGLAGKLTSTHAGPDLVALLTPILEQLGPYPHAPLNESGSPVKRQGTRMLKIECPGCGYTARTTAKWLEVGLPTCPCGEDMESV